MDGQLVIDMDLGFGIIPKISSPIESMYGIFTYIYYKNQSNVSCMDSLG